MNKTKMGLKTKITIFIIGAVYLPLIFLSIFSGTYGELNRTDLIFEMAKGQIKTELMITTTQQDYIYRTMRDLDHDEMAEVLSNYRKKNKNFKHLKKDPKFNKILDEAIKEEAQIFPKVAMGYYNFAIYLEDGTAIYSMGKSLIDDKRFSKEVKFEKFPEISSEKKTEILKDFKELEPNIVYQGKFKLFKELKARTYQNTKLVINFKETKILLVSNYLLLPSSSKVTRLVKKELGDKSGIFIFNKDGMQNMKLPGSEKFTMRELLPDAPSSFFSQGVKVYNDKSGNLFVKGEVKSEIRGSEKTTKVIYFPNKIIYGPWNYFSNLLIGIIILFAFLTIPFLLYFLKKYISPLEKILDKLKTSSAVSKKASVDLEFTSTQLAEASLENSSGMENILKSMEKINSSHKNIESAIYDTSDIHNYNMKVANQSKDGNLELISSMDEMAKAAENIGSITDIIEDISFQTNLLSLNASVEAARAGEQGKGFGVVAGSIRELSGKTSDSAKEISDLISEAIKKSKWGSKLAKQNSDIVSKMMKSFTKTAENVELVTKSLNEQSESVIPLNEGIKQINQISKVSAQKAVDCKKISNDLALSTDEMDQIISSLDEILVGKES